ncbi:lanthionine synthetase C family protein [Lentzea flaviverrucosa]|uniref:Lanthionine synthetase C-like protein n=1 Tax=Lentzea flaviverrucosa TaxID=200379 RepID=A0A1H9EZ19_9PSEU|nr:lanthionine synthetase C family protein [Lentzea flaviverrucosa]RDI35370.1 lanthionine synthetase-like protein [Lentzea flaviverrucosa]SEQ30238.1 Lanthionine synthetase C-like protein [Lentzea flaviverrucosa]
MTHGTNPASASGTVSLTADEVARQSLATGAVGPALLAVERAWTGFGDWTTAQAHIRSVATGNVDADDDTGLYYGAPAVAFLLQAAADRHPRLRAASQTMDEHVLRLTRRRLDRAATRIERGQPAIFAEYDLFHGLTGVGALLLRHHPRSDELAGILRYVVTLVTRPRHEDGVKLPGWWVAHDPDKNMPTPGGHANFGMAHGIAGLLSFLALATVDGRVVDGQREAITQLTQWFDRWQQDGPDGPWWPQWITREELHAGRPARTRPGRPSWCYGAVSIARALQLAALATDDPQRQHAAEAALAASLTDTQLNRITEPGLCHGIAGIFQTAYRASLDAHDPGLANRLPALTERLIRHTPPVVVQNDDQMDAAGLLTGRAGVELALETARRGTPPHTGWDACLLIT